MAITCENQNIKKHVNEELKPYKPLKQRKRKRGEKEKERIKIIKMKILWCKKILVYNEVMGIALF